MEDTPLPTPRLLSCEGLKDLLGPRARSAHKGDFGHVLVVGGDEGFGGAALMAAEAAARTGAGLVSVATHPAHINSFLSRRPELMTRGVSRPEQLPPLLARASVIVLGPGLGQSDWSKQAFTLVMQHLAEHRCPALLDADALNLLGQGFCAELAKQISEWILTPHPGEAARLLGKETTQINTARERSALLLQSRYGGVSILKGAGTLVAYQERNRPALARCDLGNPGMATGGMGDVLSGVIGGLLAQGLSLPSAACAGVCIHAHSADQCAAAAGERGMLASDLMPWIHRLVNPHP